MIIEGKVVDLVYSLKNADGELLDSADAQNPLTYLHGAHEIVPGLETALGGLKVGDRKQVVVPPETGYGNSDPELKLIVSRSQFPKTADLKAGMRFRASAAEGDEEVIFTIKGVEGEKVFIDGNHPLAGETLYFDVEVLTVRDATDEEKQHGHAHGPEGHGHDHDHDHEHEHDDQDGHVH